MSNYADKVLAELLGNALFKKEEKTSKVDRIMARMLEKHLLGEKKKDDKKDEGKDKFSVVEATLLLAIGSYILGGFQFLLLSHMVH